ncbi:uncharacterized protein L969DRAFT_92236 [Mixia osmundae IAM 14324]|uniref:Phosphoadenosine phosphosulphate reductase domain-containing protein n=1 Tax=Mixia osmundae (strain CBS 9802 / IAM 14324 / JCM 22182 / KY 12970) TaxID=764103 RepID=G7DTK4_MIXOS|nr:uncharacterized protein L969DRAFT_92236 [Mixia osmundae IAM 14324]KEI42812.1 hypothetical protein L969DRAFT_92236 [Mixia osmundae IAM 14324]GAA93851.1 hypothetical protein E5Q_00497 [Mixia osmundae IAM 14324]
MALLQPQTSSVNGAASQEAYVPTASTSSPARHAAKLPSVAKAVVFTEDEVAEYNRQLQDATPMQILQWATEHLPGLYQTTAFGLTGLAALDMLSKISRQQGYSKHQVPLIFIDTLYHFSETLALAERASQKYGAPMHVYYPPGVSSVAQFESMYGKNLWETDEDTYDYVVKVEPARRAYAELDVKAVITGRRRSQGAQRANIPIIEIDETGLIKVNPLASWTFAETQTYIKENDVPYNALLDRGYKSVGDWHSTKAPDGSVASGAGVDADERSGRWADRKERSECGLHQNYFQMRKAFLKKQREREQLLKDEARQDDLPASTPPAI